MVRFGLANRGGESSCSLRSGGSRGSLRPVPPFLFSRVAHDTVNSDPSLFPRDCQSESRLLPFLEIRTIYHSGIYSGLPETVVIAYPLRYSLEP